MTRDTISKFNRDTVWLAAGVLGTVVFAALVLMIQECQPKAKQAESEMAKVAGSDGKMTPGEGSGLEYAFTGTPVLEMPSSQTEPGAATSVLPLLPPADRQSSLTNRDPRTLVRREDSPRAVGSKARHAVNRSFWASRTIDVKKRLIELWHLSLAKSAKTRTWTAFSNLHKGASKKAAYTVETSH